MDNMRREDLESISQKQEEAQQQMLENKQPYTGKQRFLAWIAIADVLFALGGTLYWMFSFVPGA